MTAANVSGVETGYMAPSLESDAGHSTGELMIHSRLTHGVGPFPGWARGYDHIKIKGAYGLKKADTEQQPIVNLAGFYDLSDALGVEVCGRGELRAGQRGDEFASSILQ
jgi:hypothetical protein